MLGRWTRVGIWIVCLAMMPDRMLRAEDEVLSFGPDESQPRGTLFQWSYGTSFGGGPNRDEPIVTDRPDFTEASATVGKGVVQLESGYTYSMDIATDKRAHSYPESLFRIGILEDWLEFRIAYNHSSDRSLEGGPSTIVNHSGDDLYLGFKIGLTPQEDWLPEMAIIPQMIRPSGSGGKFLAGLNWLYGWELSDWLEMGGSTQFNRDIDESTGRMYVEFAQSWTFNYKLAEKLNMYTEWFCFVPCGADTSQTQHYFDGGFTYLVTNDLQLDIRAGVGASEAADDYFLGSGFSIRF